MSVLVVADAAVVVGQQSVASSAQAAQLETRELLLERTLAGTVSIDVLSSVQRFLSSNPAECGALPEYLGSISASASVSGADSGVNYSAVASASETVAGQTEQDNLTLVSPFAGYQPGGLDILETISLHESGSTVALTRHESHVLNLPILPGAASGLCSWSLGALGAALSASRCNATVKAEAFAGVLPGLAAEAASRGFSLAAGWSPEGCSAVYWVTLVELGVAGPEGRFDWTVRGSGTSA